MQNIGLDKFLNSYNYDGFYNMNANAQNVVIDKNKKEQKINNDLILNQIKDIKLPSINKKKEFSVPSSKNRSTVKGNLPVSKNNINELYNKLNFQNKFLSLI